MPKGRLVLDATVDELRGCGGDLMLIDRNEFCCSFVNRGKLVSSLQTVKKKKKKEKKREQEISHF